MPYSKATILCLTLPLSGFALMLAGSHAVAQSPSTAVPQQKPALNEDPDRKQFDACIQKAVKEYHALCESADVVAKGIAHECATPRSDLDWQLKQARHEFAYQTALISLLKARAANPPECWRR
jgi:hypothetical protein